MTNLLSADKCYEETIAARFNMMQQEIIKAANDGNFGTSFDIKKYDCILDHIPEFIDNCIKMKYTVRLYIYLDEKDVNYDALRTVYMAAYRKYAEKENGTVYALAAFMKIKEFKYLSDIPFDSISIGIDWLGSRNDRRSTFNYFDDVDLKQE